jgi:ribosome recycling factor
VIDDIISDAESRMDKTIEALGGAFNRIRTGRAHPNLLDSITIEYYGSDSPLSQVANVSVEDARTLAVTPWEKNLVPDIEKAIMKSDLGLNPTTAGSVIRIPMPPLTEETRKGYIRQAKQEAENSRVSIRNIRRDANSMFKDLLKDKDISEDEERRAEDRVQKLTDAKIAEIEKALQAKEADLTEI